jgi:hypothetical protein
MAGTSVLKLKVDDKEYNSSLKQAQQGMQHLEQALKDAGKSFKQVDKSVVDYVRSIGQMEAQSKTARGRVGEMSSAFVELSTQYNKMSDDVKKSDVGKALAESMEQLKRRTIDAKSELEDLNKALSNTKTPVVSTGGSDGLSSMMSVFGGNLMTKGVEMGISAAKSLATSIKDTIQQGVELSKSAEGIRLAFERINRPDLLDKLKEATHGTVSELELMRQAVKFKDFNLNLDEMGTLLAFAQQKAKDTGQSVDYMVDSIVTGLGRQSLMILDNLGLSATAVKEKMKETGDMTSAVAAIIKEQMSDAGGYVETAADRGAKSIADLENATLHLGDSFRETFGYEGIDEMSTIMETKLIKDFTALIQSVDMLSSAFSSMGIEGNRVLSTLADTAYVLMTGPLGVLLPMISESFRTYAANGGTAGSGGHIIEKPVQSKPVAPPEKKVGGGNRTTTHNTTPQETAANKVKEAERTYAETLLKNSLRLEAGLDSTLDNKKKELSAQERLFDAYNEAYATYKDPAYKKASMEAADKIKALAGEVKAETDAQESAKKAARELEAAQKKLADAQQKLADAQATGSATAVYKAQKDVNKLQDVVNRLQNPSLPVPARPTGFEAYKQSIQAEIKFDQMQVDENTLHSLLQTALKNGLDGLTVDYSGLQERIAKGIDIPDSTWEALQEEINAKLKELGIEPIAINFKTGEVKNQAKEMTKDWNSAAKAIQSVGSSMSQIEDPAAKVVGTVAQAIATIALSFSQAMLTPKDPWSWIAAAAAGTATMISTISAIHSATGYAQGGIVDGRGGGFVGGTAYSGDNVGNVRLDSGELVLNKSQQSNLASALDGNPMSSLNLTAVVSGEQILLVANRTTRRQGKGELVTWR